MKKFISVLLGGIIIFFANTSNVMAQYADKGVAFAALKNNPAIAFYAIESNEADKTDSASNKENLKSAEKDIKASKANLKALKANFRASENFKKLFKNSPDATWYIKKDAIVVSFDRDDVKTNVVYDKKGFLVHILSYYPAGKTPDDIRLVIEGAYPNDDITFAEQVKEDDLEFYIVGLESKKMYRMVAVYNGETNVITEDKKNNH